MLCNLISTGSNSRIFLKMKDIDPINAQVISRFRTVGTSLPFILVLSLLCLPNFSLRAQLTYTTNESGLTITGYLGYPRELLIPETIDGVSVVAIGADAFSSSYLLTSVVIPNSVRSIGSRAFLRCTSLTDVSIGSAVTNIGNGLFGGCVNLAVISVDAANPSFIINAGVLFDKNKTRLVQYPPLLSLNPAYTIPDTVTTVGENAFYECTFLTSITIPTSVKNIESNAFSRDFYLTSIDIPNSVTNIGDWAFNKCQSLTNINIGDSVASIGSWAFVDCGRLTSVVLPDSVTSIGSYAFYNCELLTNINLPAELTAIAAETFNACYNLTSVTIPDSVRSIEGGAFFRCLSLKTLTIPNSITNIGDYAISGCESLKSLTIPSSVTTIGVGAFGYCLSLTSIVFEGNSPPVPPNLFEVSSPNVYYLPGTTGWGPTYAGRPVLLWNPTTLSQDPEFGLKNGFFGFNITGTPDIMVVVESTTNLAHGSWVPVRTNALTGGTSYFADPASLTNTRAFYRFRTP